MYEKPETRWDVDSDGNTVPIIGQDEYYPDLIDYDNNWGNDTAYAYDIEMYNRTIYDYDYDYDSDKSYEQRMGLMDMLREVMNNSSEINFADPEFYMK